MSQVAIEGKGHRYVVVDFDTRTVRFEKCFRLRGLVRKNPVLYRCRFDEIRAVYDYVPLGDAESFLDGPRSSAIVTADGTATIDENFPGYDRMRIVLKDLCRESTDRGRWYDDPNKSEAAMVVAMMLGLFGWILWAIKM